MDENASAAETIREYYAALRQGEPLAPFFLPAEATTKFGVSESLYGYDEVADALSEQTETTAEWTVESDRLTVDDRGAFAVFADEVTLAWTDRTTGTRWRFETRWSGTLVRVDTEGGEIDPEESGSDREWRFHTMHVSAPHEL